MLSVGDEIAEVDGAEVDARSLQRALIGSDAPGSLVTVVYKRQVAHVSSNRAASAERSESSFLGPLNNAFDIFVLDKNRPMFSHSNSNRLPKEIPLVLQQVLSRIPLPCSARERARAREPESESTDDMTLFSVHNTQK
jgi:membrane-associated protease RseP (regulator of RpoE activity)